MKPRRLHVPWTQVGEDWQVVHLSREASNVHIKEHYQTGLDMRSWCRRNCTDSYSSQGQTKFAFRHEKDAFRFRLQFGNDLKQ